MMAGAIGEDVFKRQAATKTDGIRKHERDFANLLAKKRFILDKPIGTSMRCFAFRSSKTKQTVDENKHNYEPSGRAETVGGHNENFSLHDGFLTKKTNRTEGRFYEGLMGQKLGLSDFVPTCTTVQYSAHAPKLKKHARAYSKVTIEDLRRGFVKPLIYDIKLGTKTVSPKELSAAGSRKCEILRKDLRLKAADVVSSSLRRGYRFVGSSASRESRVHLGRHPDEMIKDIGARLSSADLAMVVTELDRLLAYLMTKESRKIELIGASVLIVAESDELIQENGLAAEPKIKLIDFAHSNIVDQNGLILENGVLQSARRRRIYQKGLRQGVENLADDLRALLDKKQV